MELSYDSEEQRLAELRYSNPHDSRIQSICDELLDWDGVMFSRKSYSTWYWFDEKEMNRFITYFIMKHGAK